MKKKFLSKSAIFVVGVVRVGAIDAPSNAMCRTGSVFDTSSHRHYQIKTTADFVSADLTVSEKEDSVVRLQEECLRIFADLRIKFQRGLTFKSRNKQAGVVYWTLVLIMKWKTASS